jgi:dihydroxy-acid dehydratase
MEGGPIALVQENDRIVINVPERRLDLDVSNEELEHRASRWKRPGLKVTRGVLGAYARFSSSLATGATLFSD